MAIRFETERLIIRDYEPSDAASAFDMYRREEVHEHLLRQPAPSLEFMADRITEFICEWGEKRFGFWAVVERYTGRFVGSCILKPLPNDERFEVGWHVHPDLQGRGFATEFGRGAVRYAFDNLGLDALYAIIRPENLASKRVAEKLGMRSKGSTNRYHGLELVLYELRRDDLLQATHEEGGGERTSPEAMRKHAEEILRETLARFPLSRPVELHFRPLRVTAGRAQFDRNAITLSSVVLRDFESLTSTLLHEFAHLLAYERAGRSGRGHGSAWKIAMRDLGQEPCIYHKCEVKRNVRRQSVIYKCCKCGATFERHRRLPKRGTYVHARCGGDLTLVACTARKRHANDECEVA